MSMISRGLEQELLQSAGEMPVLTLTGPRQSGKTTLVRACFPDYEYVTLENPDVRREFMDDPRYFLKRYSNHIIFDEAQRTPELFSYLQEVVDRTNEPGQFVLTGSQNFLLMNTISQTLAGRVAVRYLLPLAYSELSESNETCDAVNWIFKGGYPRLYDGDIRIANFYGDYLSTYVERDVRNELGVRKIAGFDRFVHYAAHQCGKSFNVSNKADRAKIIGDSIDLSDATKNKFEGSGKGSLIGLGAIPPSAKKELLDGVSVRNVISTRVLSFATVRTFHFGKGAEGDAAIRALIIAVLLRDIAGYDENPFIRANCFLAEKGKPVVVLNKRYGEREELEPLTAEAAERLLEEAYAQAHEKAGIAWEGQEFLVQGNPAVLANASAEEDSKAA